MAPHQAQRTLVKSRPELWAELSDPPSLNRHLGEFGDIRITRLEPESTVAWEGTAARGTVELEASGWGTKVTLTAEPAPEVDVRSPPPAPVERPRPPAARTPRLGLLARLLGRGRTRVSPPAPPAPAPPPVTPVPAPPGAPVLGEAQTLAVLTGALDDLGAAHRRPFSAS